MKKNEIPPIIIDRSVRSEQLETLPPIDADHIMTEAEINFGTSQPSKNTKHLEEIGVPPLTEENTLPLREYSAENLATIEDDPEASSENLGTVLEGIVAEFDAHIILIESIGSTPVQNPDSMILPSNPFEGNVSTKIHLFIGDAGDIKNRLNKILKNIERKPLLLPYKRDFEKIDTQLTKQFELLDKARVLHEESDLFTTNPIEKAAHEERKQLRDQILRAAQIILDHIDAALKSYEKLDTK